MYRLRAVPLSHAGSLLMAVAMALQPGCLTQTTLDKWKEMPLESARLEVVSAANDRVVLAWQTTYRGNRVRSGELELDPHLPDCDEVTVVVRDLGANARLLATHGATDEPVDPSPRPGSCAIVVLVTLRDQDVALEASTSDRRLGRAEIEAPHNHVWLAVVPLAATADAALVVAGISLAALLLVAESYAQTSWTWTP